MSTLELPGEYTFGFVTGRIIQAVADSPADDDRFPEARAATGQITFKPSVELRKSSSHYHAFVGFTTVAAKLDKLGRLVDDQTWKAIQDGEITGDDPDGPHGIWLVTGSYHVTPSVIGARIAPFPVEVTAEHTEENPLDLVTAAPPQPAPGVTLQTLIVPPGGTPNDTLVRDAGGQLAWSSVAYDSAQDAAGSATAAANSAAEAEQWAAVASDSGGGLSGQGRPHGIVDAAPGTVYTDTLGTAGAWQWIKVEDDDWSCLYGDTGWRDISDELSSSTTDNVGPDGAFVFYRRTQNQLLLYFLVDSLGGHYGAGKWWPSFNNVMAALGLRPGISAANALDVNGEAISVGVINGSLVALEEHPPGVVMGDIAIAASPRMYPSVVAGTPFTTLGV